MIAVIEGESEAEFIYQSPQAVDGQGEEILMEFSGVTAFPCGCASIKHNSDDTFTFKVDSTRISQADAGARSISITLKDSSFDQTKLQSRWSFMVEIEFTPMVIEESQGAIDEGSTNSSDTNSTAEGEATVEEEQTAEASSVDDED